MSQYLKTWLSAHLSFEKSISWKRVLKMSVVGILGFFVILLLMGVVDNVIVNKRRRAAMKKITSNAVVSPTSSPIPDHKWEFSNDYFTPKGDYYVTLSAVLKEDKYQMELKGYGWQTWTYMRPGGINTTLWKGTVKFANQNPSLGGVAWSTQGYQLALLSEDNVVEVWKFEKKQVKDVPGENEILQLVSHQSYPLGEGGFQLLYFENQQIYLMNQEKGKLYTLFPSLREMDGLDKVFANLENGTRLRPVLFALTTDDGIGFGDEEIVYLWRNGRVIRHDFKEDSFNSDGYFKAMISPKLDRLCVTSQSSGYIGYGIFKLENGKFTHVLGGMQYSDCERWVDNDTVLVEENSYFHQDVYQYFLVDMRTGKKTLVMTKNTKSVR